MIKKLEWLKLRDMLRGIPIEDAVNEVYKELVEKINELVEAYNELTES